MNPLTNMKNVTKLSERELGNAGKSSWHDQYKDSAWIFVGGLPYDLTEGDIVCIFSQYGEIVHVNLIRDKDTGKSRGFCFVCYEDQRSAILAVDNFNGIKILNRSIRVDHVAEYKVPKNKEARKSEGCAPKAVPAVRAKSKTPPRDFRETIADQIEADIKLPSRLPIIPIKKEKMDEEESSIKVKKERNHDRESSTRSKSKKSKKKRKSKSRSSSGEDEKSDRKYKKKSKRD